MKKTTLILAISAMALSLPLIAYAADAPPQHEHHMMMHQPMTRVGVIAKTKEMFAKFDLNHDGFITADEIKAAHESKRAEMKGKIFDKLDTNHDGSISRDEFMAAHHDDKEGMGSERHHHMMMAMMHGMEFKHMLATADTNHDGKYSLDEVLTYHLARFDAADTNHDGTLSPEEMKAAMEAAHGKMTHKMN